jgi:hypothetical protein
MSRTTVHSTKNEKSEESTSSASEPSHHGKASKSSSSGVNADEVKSLLALITATAGPALALTAKDKVRAIRLRKGGEKVIPTITALSQQFGINLPSHPISVITANVEQAKNLIAIQKQLVTATKQVSDAIFKAQSTSWEGATVHYSVLKRLGKTDGDLAAALAPVTEYFAQKTPAVVKADEEKRGHRKGVEEPKGSETTTTTASSSAQAPAAPTATQAVTTTGAAHS